MGGRGKFWGGFRGKGGGVTTSEKKSVEGKVASRMVGERKGCRLANSFKSVVYCN